jgi:hypothetical protein
MEPRSVGQMILTQVSLRANALDDGGGQLGVVEEAPDPAPVLGGELVN